MGPDGSPGLVLVTRAARGEPPVGEPLCTSTERRASRGGARRREGGERGPREERGLQVPLYLESLEAEYIPTYLVRVSLSLSHSCCLSLCFLPSRPIASLLPLPTLESHRTPLVAGACVSYTAGSPRHDARHRATTGTDQWFVSPRRRRASRRRRRPLSLFFLSLSLFLSFISCHARNLAERIYWSSKLGLRRGFEILQTCAIVRFRFKLKFFILRSINS